jgi:hypothetical protein
MDGRMDRQMNTLKNAIFWDVEPCRSCAAAPAHAGSLLAEVSTLKLEAIFSSETSVHTGSTRRHISENGILHSHCRENLKS